MRYESTSSSTLWSSFGLIDRRWTLRRSSVYRGRACTNGLAATKDLKPLGALGHGRAHRRGDSWRQPYLDLFFADIHGCWNNQARHGCPAARERALQQLGDTLAA